MDELFAKLQYAKNAVIFLVNNNGIGTSVDFHGLVYWAEEVERLREKITQFL